MFIEQSKDYQKTKEEFINYLKALNKSNEPVLTKN